MSRKSKLMHQAINELKKECKFGESKHKAKEQARNEAAKNHEKFKQVKGIYSHRCFNDYKKSINTYITWCCKNHSEVKTMEQSRRYIPEYIDELRDNPTMSKGKHNFHLKGKREFYFL